MTDQNTSGSRWEPTAEDGPDAAADDTVSPLPADPVADPVSDPVSDLVSDPGRPWLTRTRLVAAGSAAALFLVGGAAGYAVGHGTKDDGTVSRFAGPGGDGDGGLGRPDFDGQPGQAPPGSQSGSGDGNGGFSGSTSGNPT